MRDGSESTSAKDVYKKGYDNNKMFLRLDSMKQDYVIRLTAKRKLLYHNKWVFATELRNRRKAIYLVLVYGIPGIYFYETGNKCTEGYNQTDRRPNQRKNSVLLLSAGKRYLRAYCRMQKKASGSGSRQNVLHTVNSALSWSFE